MGYRKPSKKPKSRFKTFWFDGPGSFVIAIVLALFVRWAFFEAYVIPSGSMLPTLLHHDHIFVNKSIFGLRVPFSERWLVKWAEPSRGEVIVFKYPNDKTLFYIKRIIGLPGDRVFYENGNLYLNEELVEKNVPTSTKEEWDLLSDSDFPAEKKSGGKDNYVQWQETLGGHSYSTLLRKSGSHAATFGPFVVPDGRYFVMGDNRDNSQDSRAWEARATSAKGKVLVTRTSPGDAPIPIPKGTILKTSDSAALAVQFETTEEATLKVAELEIKIQSKEAGARGNVAAGAIRVLPEALVSKGLQVNNLESTTGGEDRRFVPRDYLVGRASFVWLSCEDTLPMVRFLCHPLKIRWNRFFHSIQ
jgi:signal peptidase I